MELWGNIFKKVDLEKYDDHAASTICAILFAIMLKRTEKLVEYD